MRIRRMAGAAGLVALALAISGCGGNTTSDVTGTVTVDGKAPPEGSSITFIPADGKSAGGGAPIESGKYTVSKVPVGATKVRITVPKFASGKPAAPRAGPGSDGERVIGELDLVDEQGQADLTYEVVSGRNEKNWQLRAK